MRTILSPLAFLLTFARPFTKLILDKPLTNPPLPHSQHIDADTTSSYIAIFFTDTLEHLQM